MMNTKKIAILMATYNGEKYICQQIDSILEQTAGDWHLYIHDDGSSDATFSILQQYVSKVPQQITLLNYPSQGGTYLNFMSMLERVESDYYMFSDQDDIWHTDKIEKSMLVMENQEKKHPDKPLVIHADLRVVDESGNTLASSFWHQAGMHPEMFHTFGQRITNVVTGCTMLFNDLAKKAALSKQPYGNPLHDEWVAIRTCACGGKVIPIFHQLIDYRQHHANALGAEACYHRKNLVYYLTSLRKIYHENRDNYQVLRSAGYGSPITYMMNKIRNMFVYNLKYRNV